MGHKARNHAAVLITGTGQAMGHKTAGNQNTNAIADKGAYLRGRQRCKALAGHGYVGRCMYFWGGIDQRAVQIKDDGGAVIHRRQPAAHGYSRHKGQDWPPTRR